MRLHRLTLTAFGPFPGTETIDFDALTAHGLFLLHGPTGAGKTSLLDAVCYALYGAVPGDRPTPTLRSHHAHPHTRTEVTLDLTLAGRRLEITRRPAYRRPKHRGHGTTEVKAQTLLRHRTTTPAPTWQPASASHHEIGEELARLLGLTLDQFCHVVLLPQGDFTRFLRADATGRAALLGRLFHTGRFADAEAWLAERRRTTEAAARTAIDQILATLHRLHQAAGTTTDIPAAGAPASWPHLLHDALTLAAHLRVDARERHTHARLALTAAEHAHTTATTHAEHAQILFDRQQRHTAAQARADDLAATTPHLEHLATTLDRAHRAAALTPLLRLDHTARADHRAAADTAAAALHHLTQTWPPTDPHDLAHTEHQIRTELAHLSELAAREREHHALHAEQQRLDAELSQAQTQHREASAWLQTWPATRAAADAALHHARDAARTAATLADHLATARRHHQAAQLADHLRTRIADAHHTAATLADQAAAARETWLRLREQRLDGMAAELATHLHPGHPCPVCGADDHPAPAQPGPGRVTRADEHAAETAYRTRQQHHDTARQTLQDLHEQAAAARAASDDQDAGQLAARITQLTADHTAAARTAATATDAEAHLHRLETEHAAQLATLQHAAELTAARTAHLDDLARRRHHLTAHLQQARGTDPTLAARTARLTRAADACTAAAAAARAAADAAARAERATADAHAAARAAGFPTLRAAADAALDDARHHALTQQLDHHRAEHAAVHATLTDPQLTAAAAEPPADPAAADAAAAHATTHLRHATATEHAAAARCAELDRLSRHLATQATHTAPRLHQHALAHRLANLAAGLGTDNTLRMRLESYVLAARLEEVAAAASTRLHHMSAGRYTLAHTDTTAPRTQRSGLGLEVLDAWTGHARATTTLSGGETFLASLALALGLADVVTHEAGGTRLDTLFIDEGFGTLDPHTLDDVLDILDTLRERNRTVGIVSHVPELRGRIPAQLHVTKDRHGSTLRHHHP